MSNSVFPSLAGIGIAIKRTPIWATKVQTASSGKELRAVMQSTPRWRYEVPLNFARVTGFSVNTSSNEMASILGLFNAQKARWDSFLFTDPYSNTAAQTNFGTGNGIATAYQIDDIEGFPVYDFNGTPAIYRTDWQGAQQLYPTARTNKALQSRTFTTGWAAPQNLTLTNVTGPDGTISSWQLKPTTTATVVHYINSPGVTMTAVQSCLSFLVKPGGYTKFAIRETSQSAYAAFDLSSGTVITTGGGGAPIGGIKQLPSGDFLVWMSYLSAAGVAAVQPFVLPNSYTSGDPAVGGNAFTGDGVSFINCTDLQFEVGSVPTSRIPTTTVPVTVTDYTLSGTGLVTLAAAPLSGAVMTWTGAYYRRVRFDMDEYTQEQMFNLCWNGGTIKLLSVK